jgi:hypothetical protein
MSIPSFERLRSDVGSTYLLGAGLWDTPVPAELKSVKQGVPMDERHCCYSALLALPAGVDLPQVSCPVSAGGTSWPLLLLTPMRPDEDGRHLMQMVFHTLVSQAPSATPAGA